MFKLDYGSLKKIIDKDKRMKYKKKSLLSTWKWSSGTRFVQTFPPRRSRVLVGIMLHSCPKSLHIAIILQISFWSTCEMSGDDQISSVIKGEWFRPSTQRVCRITDGSAPAVFLPTVATSELQLLPAFPPHKCHQTGNPAVGIYPQTFAALPHPF